LFRQVIGLIPLIYLLPKYIGITGIWIAYPAADIIAGLAVAWLLYREWIRLPHLVKKPSAGTAVIDIYSR